MQISRILAAAASVAALAFPAAAQGVSADCTFTNSDGKTFQLYGKFAVVDSFPDIKVQVVSSFSDLKVKVVDSFPDSCGKWQMVDSFPDVKIQLVSSFPDIKVQYVESFPGLP